MGVRNGESMLALLRALPGLRVFAALVAFAFVPGSLRAQTDPLGATAGSVDVLRGRIRSPSGQSIPHAHVIVMDLSSGVVRDITADNDGRYVLLSGQRNGSYLITVRALGYQLVRRRVARDPNRFGNIIATDIVLTSVGTRDPIVITATRDSLAPTPIFRLGLGTTEPVGDEYMRIDPDTAQLFVIAPGDVPMLLNPIPGVSVLPDGYSIFGQPPTQNKTLLNGARFDGTHVPQDALESVTLTKNTYDVSQGGFAGGQLELTSQEGTNVRRGQIRLAYNDPRLEWRDPTSPATRTHSQSWSGNVNGPLRKDIAFYHLAFQLDHATTPLQSLLTADSSTLALQGLRPDSIHTTSAVLQQLGIPLGVSSVKRSIETVAPSISLNLTATPRTTTTFGLNFIGSWSRQDGNDISAFSYPASGTNTRSANTAVQLSSNIAIGHILDEMHMSIGAQRTHRGPYVLLPTGSVQLISIFSDTGANTRTGVTSLPFGGAASGMSLQTSGGWDFSNVVSWISTDNRHQIKFGQSLTQSWSANGAANGPLGTYTYNSLADLVANAPAFYTRTLDAPAAANNSLQGSLSLADVFNHSKTWQLQYGVRLDWAHAGTRPIYNLAVDSAFGVRTDRVPHDIGLSPRFGFSWNSWGDRDMSARIADAAAHGRATPTPVSITGGIGAFRGVIPPSSIQSLIATTGLPNTTRQLTCVGAAVPRPRWSQFAIDQTTIPDQCADGAAAVAFAVNTPSVQVYDPSYRSPLRWSGSVNVNGITMHEWPVTLTSDYSLGFHAESQLDVNLRRTPLGILPDEQRPVYVTSDAIVPATGAIAPGASRRSDAFGRVVSTQSNLKNMSASIAATVTAPRPFFGRVPLTVTYGWTASRTQFRDAGGRDPFAIDWSVGAAPMHQVTVNSAFPLWKFSLRTQVIVNSGVRYSPLVNTDINGDGMTGDRAFIPDLATTSDTALRGQLSALLASSDSHVRDCLTRQMGHIAGNNSCRTGWQVLIQPNISVNLSIPNPAKAIAPFNDRLKISVLTENAMSLFSRLTGVTSAPLLRDVTYQPLDPTLLYVTGYDPVARRFRYQVNQQFGDPYRRVATPGGRPTLPPFRAYITAELSLGGPPHRTYAQQLGLIGEEGAPRPSVDWVMGRLRRLVENPVERVLALHDSLGLSATQTSAIQHILDDFTTQSDAILRPIALFVARHGRRSDDAQLTRRVGQAQTAMSDAIERAVRRTCPVLTQEQAMRLPAMFRCGGVE